MFIVISSYIISYLYNYNNMYLHFSLFYNSLTILTLKKNKNLSTYICNIIAIMNVINYVVIIKNCESWNKLCR